MIRLEHVTKIYGSLVAVDDLCLEIKKGEVFGFLGPNGAGKTTTIRMITGLVKPTSGKIFIDKWNIEKNPVEAKRVIGFVPDRPYLYEKLTGREMLRFIAGLYEMDTSEIDERIDNLLRLFEIEQWADELIEGYSHGMKQRLVIASALLHRPKVIVIDEPMVGLDPKGAKLVKRLFKEVSTEGISVFLSTHTLEVAEEVCDRIGIINEGKLIAVGTLEELRKKTGTEERLESIFFQLTGTEEMREIIKSLKL